MTASSYKNGVSESRTYNADNTLASLSFIGASIGNLAYTWDANKNKTAETIIGVMSGYGFSADYDFEDRLTSWNRADSTLNQSWNLSPVGNWNSITENASTQNRTHSPANEILTAASQDVFHDPKGNTTLIPSSLRPTASSLSLKWDFNNKLRAADTNNDSTDDVFYLWDALGRRVGRTAGGSTLVYFQVGQQTLADYVAGASASAPASTYLWGSYIDELVLRTSSAGNHYFHRNQQYSIIAATTSAGAIAERYAYTAYGQLTFSNAAGTPIASSAIDNRCTYTGREWDATLALYHFRARMYDPIAGRFSSRDPIGYAALCWSLFQYVKSNAVRYIDWNGETPQDPNSQGAITNGCTADETTKLEAAKSEALARLARNPDCFQGMRQASPECRDQLPNCIKEAIERMTLVCANPNEGQCHGRSLQGGPSKAVTESECSKLKQAGANGLVYPPPGQQGPPCKVEPCKHPDDFANNCKLCPLEGAYGPIKTWICRSRGAIELDVVKLANTLVHEASHNCVGGHDTTNQGPPGIKTDVCKRPDSGDIENEFGKCL